MPSWFSSFAGGAAKSISESIAEKEKDQAAMTADSMKNMYHNVVERKKEISKIKEEYGQTVNELASLVLKDGERLDDQQLITIGSNPALAKDVLKRFKDDPELSSRVGRDFFQAAKDAPTGVKATEYMDKLLSVQRASVDQTKALFNTAITGGGLVDNLVSQRGYAQAAKAAAAYGMTVEEMVGYQSLNARPPKSLVGSLDYSRLAKAKTFEQTESDAQVAALNAKTEEEQKTAAQVLAKLKVVKAATDLGHKKTEEDIRSELVNQAQDPTKTAQERALAAALVQQRVKLMHNPKEGNEDKVTQANLITIASRGFASTVESLAPGKFVTSTDMQGNISLTPKGIADTQMKSAYAQARNGIITEFTNPDGMPKSITAKNALISIGVQFDQNGKAVPAKPENVLLSAPTAPAAPAAPAANRGGPSQSKPTASGATSRAPRWNPDTQQWE